MMFFGSYFQTADMMLQVPEPLVFAVPIAILIVVAVVAASASTIDSQQRRIRNEDRLLDTLERIREENEFHEAAAAEQREEQSQPAEEEDSLEEAPASETRPARGSSEILSVEELLEADDVPEDEDFDSEVEPEKPEGVYCDPDGLCFKPLPGQSVEEARAKAREARDAALAEAAAAEQLAESEEPQEPEEPAESEQIAESEEPQESETPEAADTSEPVEIEKPESKTSRMRRLKERLAGKGKFGRAMLGVLSRADLEASDWEAIEDELLAADLGIEPTAELMENLKVKQKVAGTKDATQIRRMAKKMLTDLLDRKAQRKLNLQAPDDSECKTVGILMVGVNGGGKTTTVGKIARLLLAERKSVVLGAADTFRAAAGEQLQTWGDRVGVPVVRSQQDNADPASVAFEAAKQARENHADVVVIDTAGRLQNKSTLMDELGKIKRVAQKQVPITEVLLVIDATTGQNALSQGKIFAQAVGVTGIVLTKLDGSAKGGVIVPLQRELGIPVKLVGLGEGPDDLVPFNPGDFADALLDA